MMNNYTNSTSGLWYPDSIVKGLDLQLGAVKDTYILIYSYTHTSENDWYNGGLEKLQSRINAKSITSVKNAIKALLDNGYIISDTRKKSNGKKYTYYRINSELLYDMGIWTRKSNDVASDEMSELNESVPSHNSETTEQKITPVSTASEVLITYGEYRNVKLTQSEYDQLKNQYSDTFECSLKRLSEKIYLKGYKWNRHFETLSEWCEEDAEKARKKAENISKESVSTSSDSENIVAEVVFNYGEYNNIRLTENEHKQLKDKYPDTFEYTLKRLSDKIYTKGYKWDRHFETLSEWCEEDAEKAKKKSEKSEIKKSSQNLTKICSKSVTGNISKITNTTACNSSLSSQPMQENKEKKSQNNSFKSVLAKIGAVLSAESENELSYADPEMRCSEQCKIPDNLNRYELIDALKYISGYSYYKNEDYSSLFSENAEAVIEVMADIMAYGTKTKNNVYFSGYEIINIINGIIGNDYEYGYMVDFIEDFLKVYGKSVTLKKINNEPIYNETAYMKTLLIDYILHYKVHNARIMAGLSYELNKYGSPLSSDKDFEFARNVENIQFGRTSNYSNYVSYKFR